MAKTPHFFKIILEDVSQQGMLAIPKRFVKRYGNYLQEQVYLKVPTGAKWQVELVKSCDGFWFGNGWQPFFEYYSLSIGSFLVFGFEDFQNCIFNVLIFDNTASEINYPVHVHQENEEPNLEEQVHQPINEEHSDLETSSLPFSRPLKKRKQENCRTQSKAKRGNGDRFWKRTQPLNAEEKANALHRARTFCNPENPSFYIVMQPSYVCFRNEAVVIPAWFAKEYFTEQRGSMILNSVDGKTWSVEYFYTKTHGYKSARIYHGWRKFAQENDLEIGDVCVFELINHNVSELKVVICRENHNASKNIPSIGISKNLKHTVDPFKVKLSPSAFHNNYIYVPVTFMAECKNCCAEKAILQVENKVFPVKILRDRSVGRVRFSAGVAAFLDENFLEVGDVCLFELINSDTMLFKVSIFRN